MKRKNVPLTAIDEGKNNKIESVSVCICMGITESSNCFCFLYFGNSFVAANYCKFAPKYRANKCAI